MNKTSAASAAFTGKKITLMGLGLLGRGLGDAKFLAAAGAKLIVTDLKTEAELAPSLAALAATPGAENITFHLGGHRLEDFENRDLIIKAPNTPLDSPFIARARERGIPVEMDATLFVKLAAAGSIIVGVTGTRGKSTVTQLIYEMARAACANNCNVYLGGNVKDTATLPLIDVVRPSDIVILELDSWQLQGFIEDKISPHIGVWTNFMPDHMNYYHGDMDRYFADKAGIARFQNPGDLLIAPRDIKNKIETRFGQLGGSFNDPTDVASGWEIALPGEHNVQNASCAAVAARALGIPDEIIKKVLKDFHGLPNRLELLGEKNGIAFYNDSNATTPDATIAALNTLDETAATKNRPIILIAGGSDKELDFTELAHVIMKKGDGSGIKKIILFHGKASDKLAALLPENFSITIVATMEAAMHAATTAAAQGDIILLSPAATSFGLFNNEYDRGEQFRAAFEKIST